jgi:formylglycine-generating enzyme required for sulfatase activity
VVLATPTPKPAPPTPTPRPAATVAPLESAAEEATTEAEEATTEATTEAETTTETAGGSGPLFEDMVQIPAGPFTMGQDGSKPKNGPAHSVEVPTFEIDRFEVTNAEFAHFADQAGYVTYAEENSSKNWRDAAEGKDNHPVVYITWDDALAYCEWAGKRLPTEAEWEKAARGEDGRAYSWGSDFVADNGNFYEGGIRGTTAVGSFPAGASPYGVEDMAGNVREWVADDFEAYPGAAADADPFFGQGNKVNRGGGWFDGQDGEIVTTYNRNAGPPGTSANDDIGFRCARDAQ